MNAYHPYLQFIQSKKEEMISLVESWAKIDSGSENLEGLSQMLQALKNAFSRLGTDLHQIPLPARKKIDEKGQIVEVKTGDALFLSKHPNAPIKVFLGGHMDTVYPPNTFNKVERVDNETLKGPGVADMKGGLAVMLAALEALENSPYAGKIGWEVLINPDEEVGSSSSEHLFHEGAKRNHIGLIFEPSFSDGSLINARKGSANFTIVAHGRAAHAGRDFYHGRNAIVALSRFILGVETLTNSYRGITVNVGSIIGGGPVNIIPDLAMCRVNIRVTHPEDMELMKDSIQEMVNGSIPPEGFSIDLYEQSIRIPKLFDEKTQALFEALKMCGSDLGLDLKWKESGGVTDGNTLAAEGLPTIDTLGVIGGHIHTADEYMLVNSLAERATLTACFLMKLAAKEIELPFSLPEPPNG